MYSSLPSTGNKGSEASRVQGAGGGGGGESHKFRIGVCRQGVNGNTQTFIMLAFTIIYAFEFQLIQFEYPIQRSNWKHNANKDKNDTLLLKDGDPHKPYYTHLPTPRRYSWLCLRAGRKEEDLKKGCLGKTLKLPYLFSNYKLHILFLLLILSMIFRYSYRDRLLIFWINLRFWEIAHLPLP